MVTNSSANNGITGYTNKSFTEEGNIITYSDTTTADSIFYQPNKFVGYSHIQGLYPTNYYDNWNKNSLLFFVSAFRSVSKGKFSYGNKFNRKIASEMNVTLPIKNGKIDFEFMETIVAELEAERIAELSAYLKVSGLDNYELSVEELKALQDYDSMEWREYRIGSLFSRISTKKLPYKAKDLPTEAIDNYDLPCLTSSFRNQGLNCFAPKEGATTLKDVISIPSNSDVYRAYFQSREFTVLSDAYAIKWADEEQELSNYQYLFMVRAINKVTDLPIYSYKMKLGGWNVVKDKTILLPVVNDEIAFDFMNDYTRAISKLAIKDVVKYTDKRIKATKTV